MKNVLEKYTKYQSFIDAKTKGANFENLQVETTTYTVLVHNTKMLTINSSPAIRASLKANKRQRTSIKVWPIIIFIIIIIII